MWENSTKVRITCTFGLQNLTKPLNINIPPHRRHCLSIKDHLFDVIIVVNQQDPTILIYLFLNSSTCFGRCFLPSSGAYHCNYSLWYCPPMLLLAGVLIMFHRPWLKSVPPNTQHQPAATSVENTRSCSYSDMLLMMGENNAWNM